MKRPNHSESYSMKLAALIRTLCLFICLSVPYFAWTQPSIIREYSPNSQDDAYITDLIEHPDSGYLGLWLTRIPSQSNLSPIAVSHFRDNGELIHTRIIDIGDTTNSVSWIHFLQTDSGIYLSAILYHYNPDFRTTLLARLDPSTLQFQWVKSYQADSHNTAGGNAFPANNGDIMMVGSCHRPNSSPLYIHPIVLRIDPNGNPKWYRQKTSWISGFDAGVQAPTGDFFLVGWTVEDTTLDNYTTLTKLDSSGNTLWTKRLGTPHHRYNFTALEMTAPDRMVATGALMDTLNNFHSAPLAIAEFDTAGNLLQSRIFPEIYYTDDAPTVNSSGITINSNSETLGTDSLNGVMLHTDLSGNLDWCQYYDRPFQEDSATQDFLVRSLSLGQDGYVCSGNSYHFDTVITNWRLKLFHVDTLGNHSCNSHPAFPTDSIFVLPFTPFSLVDTTVGIQTTSITHSTPSANPIETTTCYSACVWPGDANDDGIADNNDLLSIGLTYGFTGPARPLASNSWSCQLAPDWSGSFLSGTNHKHADCNGDGTVNDDDTLAIQLNYGQTHNKTSGPLSSSTQHPPLVVIIPQDTAFIGDTIHAPVLLGDSTLPIDSIYGLAFTLLYDQGLVDTNSAWISFDTSWIGDTSNTLHLYHDFWALGSIDGAITRINHTNISGYSQIATLHIILIDNIEGKRESTSRILHVDFGTYSAVVQVGEHVQLNPVGDSVVVLDPGLFQAANTLSFDLISLSPNPTQGQLHLRCSTNQIKEIEIASLSGRSLRKFYPMKHEVDLELGDLSAGMYLVHVRTRRGSTFKKVILQ